MRGGALGGNDLAVSSWDIIAIAAETRYPILHAFCPQTDRNLFSGTEGLSIYSGEFSMSKGCLFEPISECRIRSMLGFKSIASAEIIFPASRLIPSSRPHRHPHGKLLPLSATSAHPIASTTQSSAPA